MSALKKQEIKKSPPEHTGFNNTLKITSVPAEGGCIFYDRIFDVIEEIDQSGKIEQTEKDTILCLSNEDWDAVLIEAKTKRQLQEIFRRNGRIRNFVLFTFSAGLAILLKRNPKISDVRIDLEYKGHEAVIKTIVLKMLSGEERAPHIYFGQIGKKALAHHRAYAIGLRKLEAQKVIRLDELLEEIKKTEVGKRLKNA